MILSRLPLAVASPRRRRRTEVGRKYRLAGVFIVSIARLDLLRDGVHIAKAPFEFVGREDRGGTRHMIGGIDHGSRLMDGPGRGDAQRDAVLFGDRLAA